jgi:hypothetical protein
MRSSKAGIWIRIALGIAVIVGGPAVLVGVMRSAYQTSPLPGGIAPATFDYPRPGDVAQAARGKAAPAAVVAAAAPPPQPPAPASEPETSLQPGDPCADARQEISQINARMKQSFTPSEGKYFKERLRKLGEQLKAPECAN